MDLNTHNATHSFLREAAVGHDILAAYLFGSRARGDERADSDADVAVLLRGSKGDRMTEAMKLADVAFDIMLETGIRIEALPLWEEEWEHPETFNNPALIEIIRREGVLL